MGLDGRTLHCSSCGAPFADDARFCSHCGSETTLEERRLDSICIHCGSRAASDARFCMHCGRELDHQETVLKPTDGACPRCGAALRDRKLTGVTLVECSSCGGLWLQPPTFDRICSDADLSASATRELAAGDMPRVALDTGRVRYLPCPRCRDLMVRKNFGGTSGVILDVCKDDGVWFDRGELERVVTFVRAGGLVEARRREVRRLEEEARQAKWRRDFGGPPEALGGGTFEVDTFGSPFLPRGGGGLFRLLCDTLFSSH